MKNNTIDFDGICKLVFDAEYRFTDLIISTMFPSDFNIDLLNLLKSLYDCLVKATIKIEKEINYYEEKNKIK